MTANVIIKQVLLKRGNTATTSTYTGPIGEAVVDTDLKTLRVQDGLTAGGTLLATAASVSNIAGNITGFQNSISAANVAIAGLTANAATQSVEISGLRANITATNAAIVTANVGMKSYVDAATALLWANAASQADTLSTLTANAAAQGSSLNVLNANAVTQHQTLASLISNASVQSQQLDSAAANAAVQSQSLDVLIANAVVQSQALDSLLANAAAQNNDVGQSINNLWANAATQQNEISSLRANVVAANAAIVSANIGLKSYVDDRIDGRTGNITFNGRTIGADATGGQSGITFDSAGNGEIHIADFTGINNPNPEHWLHIGTSDSEAPQNTGDLAIDFNNGLDTLRGHVTWTWDWWDSSITQGTHNDGTGTHSNFVLLKGHDHNSPFIKFNYTSGNVTVGNINGTTGIFSSDVTANNVIIGNNVKWGNGTPFLTGVSNRIDAVNAAAQSYTDTRISNLVNGAPAVLDTLYEIANSLGNNASLTTTLFNIFSTVDSNVAAANAAISQLSSNVTGLWSNAGSQGDQINNLWANAGSQVSAINSLRSNIAAANAAIITNLAYTNQLNVAMAANVTAANADIITANTAMKNYVDSQIDLATGNIEINDTTITTKVGATSTIVIDAGGELVIRDNTGIRNENPGYWLHVGDALDSSGTPHRGQIAVDYSDGLGGQNNNGHRGSVVFDYLWWNSGSQGNYNEGVGPLRRFGLFKDGILPADYTQAYDPLFTVDLDTRVFRVNSLSTSGNIQTVGTGNFTGNVRTDGYFFANGAPLVIPPLVITGNVAPTVEEGATEGALWWNDGDGRAYIKYGQNWVDLSPTVLPPVSRYIGNVVFYNHNITNVGNITPHLHTSYNIGSQSLRWNEFYVDTIDTTGNVSIGGNLFVYGNVTNISTTALVIDDSLIYMANNNPGNSIDIGIVGNFNDGTYQHTGFVRDASDNTWKLFSNVVDEPSNTVDFTFAVYDDIRVGNIASPTVVDLYANIITANTNMNSRVTALNDAMNANVIAANAAIVTANSAVVSHIVDLNGQMLANVNAANAAIVTANNAVVSHIVDLNGQMLANVNAANAAIITANTAMQNYVDYINNVLTSNINAANAAIIASNVAVVNYVNDQDAALRANITAANAAIVTANSAVVTHVDTLNSAMVANVTATNAAIITANTDMKSYVDALSSTKASATNPVFSGTALFNNPGNVSIVGNLTVGNSAVILGNLQVQGTITTVNATSLSLSDKFITLSNGALNSSMADSSGLYVAGAGANVLYKSMTDSWTFNRPLYFDSNVVWHAGNDGTGSGLDADTLDGFHANAFLKLNPDGDGIAVAFSDYNPMINQAQIQGTWVFGADGSLTVGALQSKLFNATGHVNSTNGYYVGSLDPYSSNASANSTMVISSTGTVYPSAGSGTAGIIFPLDPGGGSGDSGSIKYYVTSGEQTVLEIKTTNDADDNIILNASGVTRVVNNLQVDGASVLKGVSESFTGLSGATGVVTHDCAGGTIFYHTSPTASFTVNATNLKCDAGYTASITLVISQGATAYIPSALQIAGSAQTINWAGGSAPTGNANKKDVVSFSILNSSGTYIVLGQLVAFG